MKNVLLLVIALSCPALAQAEEGFREKFREADLKNCESKKKFLAANVKKNRCVALSAEAQAIPCDSDANVAKVKVLDKQCTEEIKQGLEGKPTMRESMDKAKASQAELDAKIAASKTEKTPVPGSIAKDACQAETADGAVLVSAQAAGYTECADQVKAKLQEEKCTAGVKKFAYYFRRGTMKPSSRTLFCK